MWKPTLDEDDGPRYQAIADAIARDVAEGLLRPGTQLPTHRVLAQHLGVTVGTVTRGYAEAERRGLTVGEVGRGTFVRDFGAAGEHGWGAQAPDADDRTIDLSLSTPWISPDGSDGERLAQGLDQIARTGPGDDLLRYQPESASPRHRSIIAAWLERFGVSVSAEEVVVTCGAQHAMTVILSSFLRPGDSLLTAELTYPGVKAAAQMFGLRIRGLEMDDQGILPEALERACLEQRARGLYCVPRLQNPTLATMSAERRKRIAEVARKHDLLILEDEVHVGVEGSDVPPIQQFAPERTFYVTTISKSVTFGLRMGFVAAPPGSVERVRSGVRTTVWMPPPVMTELATRWLQDGTAIEIARGKLDELAARNALVDSILGPKVAVRTHPESVHSWLTLPSPWRSDEFVAMARQRGILLAGAEAFAVGRAAVPHAVRISVANVPHREQLRQALEVLAEMLDGCPEPYVDIL